MKFEYTTKVPEMKKEWSDIAKHWIDSHWTEIWEKIQKGYLDGEFHLPTIKRN